MLIDIHTPLVNPHHGQPVTCEGGEIIDIYSLPIPRPDNYDLGAVCIAPEQMLLPPHHACCIKSK